MVWKTLVMLIETFCIDSTLTQAHDPDMCLRFFGESFQSADTTHVVGLRVQQGVFVGSNETMGPIAYPTSYETGRWS